MLQVFLCVHIECILLLQTLVNGEEDLVCFIFRLIIILNVLCVFLTQAVILAGAYKREYSKGDHAQQDKDQQDRGCAHTKYWFSAFFHYAGSFHLDAPALRAMVIFVVRL